jgi:two-component system CheB/CheR fusion protein
MAVAADEHQVGLVRVQPFNAGRTSARFLVVTYERGVVRPDRVDQVSDEATSQIADLQRELLFVRESLQATIEELETSNEELQATNEELLAANEELQSTNEELQSVNEELNTVNAEHQAKILELTQVNADLDNLFDATTVGTVFVDEDLRIRRFTRAVTQQFSLLSRDVGRPIEHITHHFRDLHLVEDLRKVQSTVTALEREVSTIDGQRYLVSVSPYLTASKQVRGGVATFVDVTQLRDEQAHRAQLQGVLDSLPAQVVVIDRLGTIALVNRRWQQSAREAGGASFEAHAGLGSNYLEACRSAPEVREALEALLAGTREGFSHQYPCHGPAGRRWFMMHVGRLGDGAGAVITHIDVTAEHLLAGGPEADS